MLVTCIMCHLCLLRLRVENLISTRSGFKSKQVLAVKCICSNEKISLVLLLDENSSFGVIHAFRKEDGTTKGQEKRRKDEEMTFYELT